MEVAPKYSVGYNHDLKLLDVILQYKEHVFEVYFPIPIEYLGSGRNILQRNKYKQEIDTIISFCALHGFKSNLLINPACEGKLCANQEHMERVLEYVSELRKKGLTSVTLLNPNYMALFSKKMPDLEIVASVNCLIDSAEKISFFKMFGVGTIILDRDINRKMDLLADLAKTSKPALRLMVNEGCIKNCINRSIYFNYVSHNVGEDARAQNLVCNFCREAISLNEGLIFKSPFIRPEDIKSYSQITSEFKLVTRGIPTQKIERMLAAYVAQKFDGNLLDILDTDYGFSVFESIDNKKLDKYGFFKQLTTCDGKCDACDYCRNLARTCGVKK